MSAAFFATPEEFGAWLEEHHDSETELIVGFYKKAPASRASLGPSRSSRRFASAGSTVCAGASTTRATRSASFDRRNEPVLDGFEERLRATPAAAEWFYGQAPYYRRTAIHWVTSAKRPETRERPLAQLVDCSAAGERVPPLRPAVGLTAQRLVRQSEQ